MERGTVALDCLYRSLAQPVAKRPRPLGPFDAWDRNRGLDPPSSCRLFIYKIRLAGGGSSGKVLPGRKLGWRGIQFGVLDGEGPTGAVG
jgi:hypothetical protein